MKIRGTIRPFLASLALGGIALSLASCNRSGGKRDPQDLSDPTISIESPTTAPTYRTSATPILIGGTASDDIGIETVTWSNADTGGAGVAAGKTIWTATIDIVLGPNVITVTATDAVGKTGTDTITVTRTRGEVYAWGLDADGQVGVGTPPIHAVPQGVADPTDPSGFLTGVSAVGGGGHHSMTAQSDATARAWGWSVFGQIGNGTAVDVSVPLQVTDPPDPSGFLTGAASVACGWWHSVALLGDGTVRTWGANWRGQLGDGSTSARFRPVQVVDPTDPSGFLTTVAQVAAGDRHTLALLADGTVRGWGENGQGQLGDGTATDRSSPVQVTEPLDPSGFLTNVAAIASLGNHCVAVKADGTVWAWGRNQEGQLGDGTTLNRLAAVQVVDSNDPSGFLTGAAGVAAGLSHSIARKTDGTVRTWGRNPHGQLGNGTLTDALTPVQVIDPNDPTGFLTGVAEITSTESASFALLGDGTVRSWGGSVYGEIGDGTTIDRSTPVRVVDPSDPSGFLTGVSTISGGWYHVIAGIGDGTARTWGRDFAGEIGIDNPRSGPTADRVVDPADPTGFLTEVSAIARGFYHTAAVRADGTARAWGWNDSGQLGDGGQGSAGAAMPVVDPSDPSGFLTGTAALAGGVDHTIALGDDGSVRSWGSNLDGQLGIGILLSSPVPVRVIDPNAPSGLLEGVTSIAAGNDHSVALMADGTVRAWGDNGAGQLGDGTTIDSLQPLQTIDPQDPTGFLTGIVAIAAGGDHTIALKGDGTVRAWGLNGTGQLGDGTNTSSQQPVQVIDPGDPTGFLTGVVAIAGGGNHTLALEGDGTVRAWGSDNNMQLGNASVGSYSAEPVQVEDPNDPTGFLTAAAAIAAGGYHSVVLKDDGTVWDWGTNTDGQLGDPAVIASRRPRQVVHLQDPSGFLSDVVAIAAGQFHTIALK